MKPHALLTIAMALLATSVLAGPVDSAVVAAMKLPEVPNYGWVTEVTDDARSYTIDGKTDLTVTQDYSLVTMPLIAAMRRGLGRGSTQAEATAVFKGDEKFVIETPDGWKRSDELISAATRDGRGPGGPGGGYGGRGGFGGGRRGGMRGRGGWGGSEGRGTGTPPAYSNLQRTLSRPHEEVAIIVAGYTEIRPEPDGASGTLSETNAKLLLVHAGQKDITPLHAKGTFRLWVKDGELTKYQVTLEGTLAVTANGERREVTVHQTATTTLRAVGSTKIEVPEEARKKLGA
jgi:hypothetical protein